VEHGSLGLRRRKRRTISMDEIPIKVDKTDATQGKTGLGVRYVLIAGLILALIAFVIVWQVY
jgi:hypothetical protein